MGNETTQFSFILCRNDYHIRGGSCRGSLDMFEFGLRKRVMVAETTLNCL